MQKGNILMGTRNPNVDHPAHYNIPGRKECIDEMLDKFGTKKVQAFCELNEYKYRYRHELKNGDEDLAKAQWYHDKLKILKATDPESIIADRYGIKGMMIQSTEEMSELIKVFMKFFRLDGTGAPLAPDIIIKDLMDNRIEEIADVLITIEELIHLLDCEDKIRWWKKRKIKRTLERGHLICTKQSEQ